MNAAYLHLLLCHLPTFATLFALALLAAAALRRDDALLGAGALPLDVLQQRMDAWLAEQLANRS